MNAYETAAKYMAIIRKAGARHSAKDNAMVQEMHDRACELGAKCHCDNGHPQLKAMVYRHPGHPNQKVHGNRFGGFDVTKESLRRLKGDKEGREKYKTQARKKGASAAAKVREGYDYQYLAGDVKAGKVSPADLEGFVSAKRNQIKGLRSDKGNEYKQQQATLIESKIKSTEQVIRDVRSGAIKPGSEKPVAATRKPATPKRIKTSSVDVDMSTAQAAIRAAGGDKQAAWSKYIQLNYQKTGSLSPGIDAKDFFRAIGHGK